jgi:predicted permease
MSRVVPRPVAALLEWIVPARLVAGVIDDLDDDYRRVLATRRPLAARLWLYGEVMSIGWAFGTRAVGQAVCSGPAVMRDTRLAWRGLMQAPLAALGAAATLSVGIFAVLLATGLAGALLLRPVSLRHGETLRRVAVIDGNARASFALSFLEAERARERIEGRARHALINLQPAVLRAEGGDLQTMIEVVDGAYFELIGAPIVLGRALVSADDRPAAPPVTVIGEGLWRRRFGANPAVIGRIVSFNRAAFTIVGVTAASGSASALGAAVDAWTPLAHADAVLNPGWRTDPQARWFSLFAVPTTSPADLDAGLAIATRDLAERQPDAWRDRRLRSAPGTVLAGGQRSAVASLVWMLGGMAVLILAAGAANVGGVLIARASASARQTAIHLALGSGRLAIARRLVIEGMLLGCTGGGLALLAYVWARRQIAEVALLPTLSLRLDLPLDGGFALAVVLGSAVTGLALAVGPAGWAMRVDAAAIAGAGEQRAIGGATVSRTRRLLVSAQVGVSLMLVVGAVLFSRSLVSLTTANLGFPQRGLVALDFDLAPAAADDGAGALARAALDRVAMLPGVAAAAMSNRAPVDRSLPSLDVRLDPSGNVAAGETTVSLITPNYFATVGVPLVAGRTFTAAECEHGDDVAIVNETLSRRLWPGGDAIGRTLAVGADRRRVRVVGVARDAKYRSITDSGVPHVYRPTPAGFNLTMLVRTAGDPRRTLVAVQDALDRVGPGVVGFFPRTMDDHLAGEVLPARVLAGAATGLGSIGLGLSGVGLYGLVAWLVELRRREIGIRLALGASPSAVVRLVIRQAVWAAAPGVVAGTAIAVALGAALRGLLFGVGPLDPWAFGIGTGALAAVVVLAAWVPSARAARIDPAATLRDS